MIAELFKHENTVLGWVELIAFFFFIVLMVMAPYSTAVAEVVFVVVFICGITKIVLDKDGLSKAKRLFLLPGNLAAWALFLVFGISMLAGGDIARSFKYWFFKWGEEVLLFYLAQFFLTSRKVLFLLKVFLFCAFVVFVQAVIQYVTSPLVWDGVAGPFNNPNNLGSYCALVIFIVLWGLFEKERLARILYMVCFLFCLAALLFTYCRGALVATVIGVILISAVTLRRKMRLLFWMLFVPLFLWLVTYVILWSDNLLVTDSQRILLLSSAINMFAKAPLFGQGVGLFIMKVQDFGGIPGFYAHNCYLQMLAETGIFGLTSFLFLIGYVLSAASRYLVNRGNLWGSALYFGIATFLLHATFDNQLYSARLSLIFWVLLAFLYILAQEAKAGYNYGKA